MRICAHSSREYIFALIAYPIALILLWLMLWLNSKNSTTSFAIMSFFLILGLTLNFIGNHTQQTAIRDLNLGVEYVEGTTQRLVFGAIYLPFTWSILLGYSLWIRKKSNVK